MIEAIIQTLHQIMNSYGALGVFIATLVEEIVVILPSTLVQLAAGFLVMNDSGFYDPNSWLKLTFIVSIPIAIGVLIGSLIFYWIGYALGKPFIDRYGKYMGMDWHAIEEINNKFARGYADDIVLLILRIIPIFSNAMISVAAGLVRIKIFNYIYMTLIGGFLRAFALGYIGWQAGSLYVKYAELISIYEKWVMALLGLCIISGVLGVLFWIWWGKRRVK